MKNSDFDDMVEVINAGSLSRKKPWTIHRERSHHGLFTVKQHSFGQDGLTDVTSRAGRETSHISIKTKSHDNCWNVSIPPL